MTDALYEADGSRFVPSELCRGPWDVGAQHGGPVAALIARAVERFEPSDPPLAVTRTSIELLKPVPLEPLAVEVGFSRPGKRVQLVAVTVSVGDAEVVRAVALRVQRAPDDLGEVALVDDPPLPGPDEARERPVRERAEWPTSFGDAVDFRVLDERTGITVVGPGRAWFRLKVPVVAGEEPSPLMRAMVAADFGNGIGSALDFQRFVFVNPDLTVHLHRLPAGEWVALDAATWVTPGGAAYAESTLHDERGRIGRAVQSLYVADR